jgi:hypothetical protein
MTTCRQAVGDVVNNCLTFFYSSMVAVGDTADNGTIASCLYGAHV